MNKDLHNIDDLFRKALEENQELPSASVWENIDKTLDKKKVVSISKKYNKLKWVAAVLLLFSLGMAMYTLHIRKQNRELVKQNREGKNILKQKSQTKISHGDSSILNTANANTHVDTNDHNNIFKNKFSILTRRLQIIRYLPRKVKLFQIKKMPEKKRLSLIKIITPLHHL